MARTLNSISGLLARDIAVDLGTSNTVIYVRSAGVVLEQPSVAAVHVSTGRLLAVGRSAKEMVGRTPVGIKAVRPLRGGTISDFGVCEKMLRYFIREVHSGRPVRPRMVICAPSGITPVEQRAVQEVAEYAGARKPVFIIEEPLAAAIGSGIRIAAARGNMIVDIGGGTTEMAIISLGGIVVSRSFKVAGDAFEQAIKEFVDKEYSLDIGEQTAEIIKAKYTSAWPFKEELYCDILGRDRRTGLPKNVSIPTTEFRHSIMPTLHEIASAIKTTLDESPPELVADVMETGIYLAGGGSLLMGMPEFLSSEVGISFHRVKYPQHAVAIGSGLSLEEFSAMKSVLLPSSTD